MIRVDWNFFLIIYAWGYEILQSYLESLFRLELSFSNKLAAFDTDQINLLFLRQKPHIAFFLTWQKLIFALEFEKLLDILLRQLLNVIPQLKQRNVEWW